MPQQEEEYNGFWRYFGKILFGIAALVIFALVVWFVTIVFNILTHQ